MSWLRSPAKAVSVSKGQAQAAAGMSQVPMKAIRAPCPTRSHCSDAWTLPTREADLADLTYRCDETALLRNKRPLVEQLMTIARASVLEEMASGICRAEASVTPLQHALLQAAVS